MHLQVQHAVSITASQYAFGTLCALAAVALVSVDHDRWRDGWERLSSSLPGLPEWCCCAAPWGVSRHAASLGSPEHASDAVGHATDVPDYAQRVMGALLGAACGDTLGAAVEGKSRQQVLKARQAQDLTFFQRTPRGYGRYTDDTQMTVALARCLVRHGRCDPAHAAAAYAQEYDPRRGYGGSASKILRDLKNGADWQTTARRYIPTGSWANGGAMRIAPVGLAYRHAPLDVLVQAVKDALVCTHTHPDGIDGALVQAAAVGFLATSVAAAPACGKGSAGVGRDVEQPLHLLRSLAALAGTGEMALKLLRLKKAVAEVPPGLLKTRCTPWSQHLKSPGWQAELAAVDSVAEPFQMRATDATAAALCTLCFHWDDPEDAIVAAVHYGGDTDTVACMAGALAGALHGDKALPCRWLGNLENGKAGRDEIRHLAMQLSELDCRV